MTLICSVKMTFKTKICIPLPPSTCRHLKMSIFLENIEISSWKAHAYGISTLVGEVSEIERVRTFSDVYQY